MRYLLNQLFSFFLPMLFLAAGPAVDAGAMGGGDASGAVVDQGGGEPTAGDDSATTPDGSADESQVTTSADTDAVDPDKPTDLGDGRIAPAKWKKAFEAAKAAGVEKEVKQAFFGIQRLTKVIPEGINGAIQLAKAVEEFGGVEGVQQLQADLETHRADSEMFERADPKWVEAGFEENPESALKLFAHTLDYVSEKFPENYDHLASKIVFNDLKDNSPVHEIYSVLAGLKDNPAALELAKRLAAYYNQRRETSQKVPEKKVDAQQKALTDREAKLEQKEMGLRFTQVNAQIFPTMRTQVTKGLEAEAKAAGIDAKQLAKDYPGAWQDMLGTIHKRIMAAAVKDQRFVDKHYALVKKGDLKRAAAAVNAKHESIIPEIVRAVAQGSGLFKGKKVAEGDKGRPTTSVNAGAGWTYVSARPSNESINWGKTTTALQLEGKYILNDGKQVIVKY